MEFRDRRPAGHLPGPDDYETPLTRTTLAEANRRFRESGMPGIVGNNPDEAARLIKQTTKNRFLNRRSGQEDFESVGAYLAALNGLPGSRKPKASDDRWEVSL